MYKKAFSLVELSIVLVILGLLTGGILTGQSLIKAAELRAVSTEYTNHLTALNNFKDKYFALPGDMNNATSLWGKLSAYCNADSGTASANGTCNGDGNGFIVEASSSSAKSERFMFWQQLALAGLIEGQYTGISGTQSQYNTVGGTNAPLSKFSGGIWAIENSASTGSSLAYDILVGLDVFEYGAQQNGGNWDADDPVMTPEEAWNIDKKMDDGHPAYGQVVALGWNNLCAYALDGSHASDDYNAAYKLSDNTKKCALMFRGLSN